MSKALVKQLLMSSNYWTLNKTIVSIFGIETALLLTVFAEAENMMADKDGWFYQTTSTIEKITTLKRFKQDNSIKELEDMGILVKEVRGMPAKKYFKIDYKALNDKIVGNQQTSMLETSKQDCWKPTTNKELSNKELSNKESTKDKEILSGTENHVPDRIPYKLIIDYLNEKAERQFKHTPNKTQTLIRARWAEGFKLDDFKRVIDIKVTEWKTDEDMKKYLRPETLFGTKFEGYLNQPIYRTKQDKAKDNLPSWARDDAKPVQDDKVTDVEPYKDRLERLRQMRTHTEN